jgi:hypothetical protein
MIRYLDGFHTGTCSVRKAARVVSQLGLSVGLEPIEHPSQKAKIKNHNFTDFVTGHMNYEE